VRAVFSALLFLGIELILITAALASDASQELKAFPPAGKGMTRFVIFLPSQADEDLLKIQLLVGKSVKLDPQNQYFYGGRLETETVTGWGYDYHILHSLGAMAGTLMAVDPNAPKIERFITLGGEPELLRYNSRLPLVVYVPEGVEIRYRIWHGDQKLLKASEN